VFDKTKGTIFYAGFIQGHILENQKVVRNACRALEIATMEIFAGQKWKFNIGYVKDVGSYFAILFVEL